MQYIATLDHKGPSNESKLGHLVFHIIFLFKLKSKIVVDQFHKHILSKTLHVINR